jgi:hypothetical protein
MYAFDWKDEAMLALCHCTGVHQMEVVLLQCVAPELSVNSCELYIAVAAMVEQPSSTHLFVTLLS